MKKIVDMLVKLAMKALVAVLGLVFLGIFIFGWMSLGEYIEMMDVYAVILIIVILLWGGGCYLHPYDEKDCTLDWDGNEIEEMN